MRLLGVEAGCRGVRMEFQPRVRFGNVVIVALLCAQVVDGALTYLGVSTFGVGIEANPLMLWLMFAVGEGPTLASAKLLAGFCAVVLHLQAVHGIVAALTLIYVGAAIVPWMQLLFF
ncbi:MAG: hypothetical protein CL476_03035 [Acidobacteria bacterium]|nr:hypothetical protein [Acidobacteriota bacterium]